MNPLLLLFLLAVPASAQQWPTPRTIEQRAVDAGWTWARNAHEPDSLIVGVSLVTPRGYVADALTDGWAVAIPPLTGSWGSFAAVYYAVETVNVRSWVTLVEITLHMSEPLPGGSLNVRRYLLALPAVSVPQVVTSPD